MKIFVYPVACNPVCMMPDNMLQKSLLPLRLNNLQKVNHWIIWIESTFPIKI